MNRDITQTWEQVNEISKSAMESMLKFNEVASRSVERFAQQQLAVMSECFESTVSQLKSLSEAKDVKDVLAVQTRLANECGERWMAMARKNFEITLQAQAELGQWVNDSINRLNAQTAQAVAQAKETMQQAA